MAFNPSSLSRATLARNPHYKQHGMKSYVRALQKCKPRRVSKKQ